MGALMGASINAASRQQEKTYNRPDGRGNAIPLWWLAPPPFPHFVVGLWTLNHGAMSLQESIERFILSPEQGWQGNTSHTSEHILKERSDAQNIVSR